MPIPKVSFVWRLDCITTEIEAHACVSDASFPKSAQVLLEYRAECEGYWTSEKFTINVKDVTKIAKFKYPREKQPVMFIFDQTSCHYALRDDALNSRVMNVRPGQTSLDDYDVYIALNRLISGPTTNSAIH